MTEFLNFAVESARQGGAILAKRWGSTFRIDKKSAIDLVTEVDREVEALVLGRIKRTYPEHRILSEEKGVVDNVSDYRWILDPLDGTTNFAHAYPCFCVSIALEIKGELQVGVIYNPLLNELFSAVKGEGSFLNGKAIHVSATADLNNSLLATGFAYNIRETEKNNLKEFNKFALTAQGVRRDGSAAIDLAYVACGRFDGLWEYHLKPWDMAAGIVLLKEAGGKVSAMDGSPFRLETPDVLATNGKIHGAMEKVLRDLKSTN